jgi:S1-C subfamily serine protease
VNAPRRLGAIACVVALLIGCEESITTPITIVDDTIASAVRVEAQGCGPRIRLGTGTTIDDGVVITAAHVVAGTDHVDVVGADGRRSSADVVAFDPRLDIAALRPAMPVARPVALRPTPVAAGDVGVMVVNRADDTTNSIVMESITAEVARTVTIRTTDIYRDADVERPGFEIDALVEPGDSGAMVHFPTGVAGVVWARSTIDPDRAWAVLIPPELIESSMVGNAVDTGPCP